MLQETEVSVNLFVIVICIYGEDISESNKNGFGRNFYSTNARCGELSLTFYKNRRIFAFRLSQLQQLSQVLITHKIEEKLR